MAYQTPCSGCREMIPCEGDNLFYCSKCGKGKKKKYYHEECLVAHIAKKHGGKGRIIQAPDIHIPMGIVVRYR